MNVKAVTAAFALCAMSNVSIADSARSDGSYEVAFAGCGWYVVLGCGRNFDRARRAMDDLGGPFAGGGAGLQVANTDDYPNFRDGYYCVVDGPYISRDAAQSIAWTEAVPDSYVKNGC